MLPSPDPGALRAYLAAHAPAPDHATLILLDGLTLERHRTMPDRVLNPHGVSIGNVDDWYHGSSPRRLCELRAKFAVQWADALAAELTRTAAC